MNHDATHCADYKKSTCPKTCYRAQLTEELRNIVYLLPTSWAHLKGTKECPLMTTTVRNNDANRRSPEV